MKLINAFYGQKAKPFIVCASVNSVTTVLDNVIRHILSPSYLLFMPMRDPINNSIISYFSNRYNV